MNYWLMKTEPNVFSYDDLCAAHGSTEPWDGVRNYQARNYMRDQFAVGDLIFIYHSSIKTPAIIGIAEVVRSAYPDVSALDPESKYYDIKSAQLGKSRWVAVDVKAKEKFQKPLTVSQMRNIPGLANMKVLQKGQRLSIMPVTGEEWDLILSFTR